MTRRIVAFALALVAAGAAGCDSATPNPGLDTTFGAQMASTWHYVGAPQRVQIGIFANDAQGLRPVTNGTIDVAFSFLEEGGDPVPGPTATATFVPVPGSPAGGDEPAISSGGSGVYEAEDVSFDRPGLWRATVSLEIQGVARELTSDFPVDPESQIPAPGMPALATETLTNDSNVRAGAIDSMADVEGEVPDPELHEITIADAIAEGRPALVLFGTPAYCESRFCGPEVTELQRLAADHPDRAVYIHVEIWKNFNASPQVINEGAADWLYRPDTSLGMTEPWLYLIGADGTVADRWGPLFDVDEVAAALEALPPMDG